MQLKVLSWNVWCDGDFEKISRFLEESKADIIGLQEIVREDSEHDVVAFLAKRGYHHAVSDRGPVVHEKRILTGVFSKYPIRKSAVDQLSPDSEQCATEVHVEIEGKIFSIFSVHLKHIHLQEASPTQAVQVDTLLSLIPKERVLVMGDFNATPNLPYMERMRNVLQDTDQKGEPTWSLSPEGCSTCKPQGLTIRYDYIFASHDLKTHSFKVEKQDGSDHVPVSLVLEV